MAWRVPTTDDLVARVSMAEIEAYSRSAAFGDPVGELLNQTADEARGYIAANRAAVLCDTEHSLPPMLIGPAMDIAACVLQRRMGIVPNEARQSAETAAKELLVKISEGKITPEPGKTVESGSTAIATPSIAVKPAIL